MMKQQDHLQIFDLILTVRSPLFIGDGRMYTKAEYLYNTRNGRASLLDEQKFFTFLTDRGLIDRYIQFMLCNQSNLRDFLTEDCGVSDRLCLWLQYRLLGHRVPLLWRKGLR